MTPAEMCDRLSCVEIDETDPLSVSIAVERYENAINAVLKRLERQPTGDTAVVSVSAMCQDIAKELRVA